jgi:2-polyprenyl-6-hydroxyphenyl methylase/3-demethylubiquinone-9 3-methyltransferase
MGRAEEGFTSLLDEGPLRGVELLNAVRQTWRKELFVSGYYAEKLSGKRLQRCYEIAPPRVLQYLEAEIDHVLGRLRQTGSVLELGCGYGRIAGRLAQVATRVVGVDTAPESMELARRLWRSAGCEFLTMDAIDLHFPQNSFDAVLCLQNGICAFGVDELRLIEEALRVTREGGIILLSSYSDNFWPHRLAWFEAQAAEGLVGRIDHVASKDGVIVCEDGFRAGRRTPDEFRSLCSTIGVSARISEVDGSSVFCEITKPSAAQ